MIFQYRVSGFFFLPFRSTVRHNNRLTFNFDDSRGDRAAGRHVYQRVNDGPPRAWRCRSAVRPSSADRHDQKKMTRPRAATSASNARRQRQRRDTTRHDTTRLARLCSYATLSTGQTRRTVRRIRCISVFAFVSSRWPRRRPFARLLERVLFYTVSIALKEHVSLRQTWTNVLYVLRFVDVRRTRHSHRARGTLLYVYVQYTRTIISYRFVSIPQHFDVMAYYVL